ncbi:MAG: hypothetical protein NC321_06305 [Clostridium sp.]|nr:hypothetical protein [Clostridium sp.]
MSGREKAEQLLHAVPDYKLGYVIAYLQGIIAAEEANKLSFPCEIALHNT